MSDNNDTIVESYQLGGCTMERNEWLIPVSIKLFNLEFCGDESICSLILRISRSDHTYMHFNGAKGALIGVAPPASLICR